MSSSDQTGPDAEALGGDEVDQLRLVVLRLARQIRSNAVADVTPSQTAVAATLARHGPCTIGQIAEHENVKAPSISKIVDGLVAKGLVERRVDPADRRRAPVALSDGGQQFIAELRGSGIGWLASRLESLDADERTLIREVLPVLERLLAVDE